MARSAVIDTSKVVETTLRRIGQGTRRIALLGAPSSGKTTALSAVAASLLAEGWSIFRTSMPNGDDAGPLALTLLADQVGSGEVIRDPGAPWSAKLDATVAAIRNRAQTSRVLITLDDPLFEQAAMMSTPFTEHATSLIGALSGIENVAVVVASSRPIPQSWGQLVKIEVETDAESVLAAFEEGAFAAAAGRLRRLGLQRLSKHSPTELRLMVAIEDSRGQRAAALDVEMSPLALLQRTLDAWGGGVRRALHRLAVPRTPFDDQALEELLVGVSAQVDAVIRGVIVQRTPSGWLVPEIFGRAFRPASSRRDRGAADDPDERRGHEVACAFHQRAFKRAASGDVLLTSIRHELEELHHLTQLNDAAALLDRSVYFVDYYNALGKRLGQLGVRAQDDRKRRRFFEGAVTAYERVLELDETDAYAHHYLAYNIDWLATDPVRAEEHYRTALHWRPDQVWHHGRWISFLITRGRVLEARHAWSVAMNELGDGIPGRSRIVDVRPGWLFEELHRQVARLLLYRGELDFARLVLDDLGDLVDEVPSLPWVRAERRLLERLEQAARDQLVFPSTVDPARRWDGPHLVHAEARPNVKRWWAGRIETWLDREVVLRLGEKPDRFGRKTLSASEFRRLLGVPLRRVPAGTFIELVQWHGSKQQIFVHPGEVEDPDLPPVLPPADRYLRRGLDASSPGA